MSGKREGNAAHHGEKITPYIVMEAETNAPAAAPPPAESANETVTGYCFSCRAKKPMHHATMTRLANSRWAFTGTCVTCGKKMYKISAALPIA